MQLEDGNGKLASHVSVASGSSLVFRKRDNGFGASAAELRNLIKRIFDHGIACGLIWSIPRTPMRFVTKARARTRSLSPEELKV